ncbi:MAG: helix-turn-helix domain-containing protein [Defluviitaleaceae bacterium]|nr:helix-turn-helix domain-containing protein [Defluviitaleaceae bacterium]
MKDMNLAAILITKRRERKITQEELAAHVGVSKASVSKWENGVSYPDIAHLPVIASYFDISIDQLMNYAPQLTEAEVVKLHERLAARFATEPFEDAMAACDAAVKKHYSCYPFVMQAALLYLNHGAMAPTDARKLAVYQMAIDLCRHLQTHCRDGELLQLAAHTQAMCHLTRGEADPALKLLADKNQMPRQYGIGSGAIISQALQMQGNMEKANEVEQAELYTSLMQTFDGLLSYVRLNLGDYDTARVAYERALALAELFNMGQLNVNNMAILYAYGAHMYQAAGESAKALDALKQYVDVCTHGFFPFAARGDAFFDKVEGMLGKQYPLPRSEAVVKESMLNDVLLAPIFESLHNEPAFKRLVQKMQAFITTTSC